MTPNEQKLKERLMELHVVPDERAADAAVKAFAVFVEYGLTAGEAFFVAENLLPTAIHQATKVNFLGEPEQ